MADKEKICVIAIGQTCQNVQLNGVCIFWDEAEEKCKVLQAIEKYLEAV